MIYLLDLRATSVVEERNHPKNTHCDVTSKLNRERLQKRLYTYCNSGGLRISHRMRAGKFTFATK